jgi:hypothetical protein
LGDVAGAREEFAQILLADPRYALDKFTVPPDVVATFESVRGELRPRLDQILKDRGLLKEPPPVASGRPSPLLAAIPFGLPQFFVLDQPGWGALWLSVETVGLTTNAIGYWAARGRTDFGAYRGAQYAGLAVLGVSYALSVVQGLSTIAAIPHPLPAASTAPTGVGLEAPKPLPEPFELRWSFAF